MIVLPLFWMALLRKGESLRIHEFDCGMMDTFHLLCMRSVGGVQWRSEVVDWGRNDMLRYDGLDWLYDEFIVFSSISLGMGWAVRGVWCLWVWVEYDQEYEQIIWRGSYYWLCSLLASSPTKHFLLLSLNSSSHVFRPMSSSNCENQVLCGSKTVACM